MATPAVDRVVRIDTIATGNLDDFARFDDRIRVIDMQGNGDVS